MGCGYVGLPLGKELARQGHQVFGLRRSWLVEAELLAAGITPLHADLTQPETLARLPRQYDWVVNCTASGGGGAEDYRKIYLEGNRNLLNWLREAPPKKFIYTSSTSVYGQNDGAVVTETSPTEPDADTARVLVETEQLLLAAAQGSPGRWQPESASPASHPLFPAVILRVAGIYGPGRGYAFKQFLRGEARLEGDGSRWLNMIHRDDLIGIIHAALDRGVAGEVYNAVDNEPVRQRDFYAWLAKALNQKLPPTVMTDENSWKKRGVTNKRVANAKLLAELQYPFQFPNYRDGYAPELEKNLCRDH